MIRFILAILLLLTALGLWQARKKCSNQNIKNYLRWAIYPTVSIGLLFAIWSMTRVVPPRSVGIETTLGKVTNSYDSGLHFVKPWAGVHKFPATVQTTLLKGKGTEKGETAGCITVRLGNQTTACVDILMQWQVNTGDKKSVEALYARWKSFDHIEPNLMRPQMQHAVLGPFEKYNPLDTLAANGQLSAPLKALEDETRSALSSAIGDGITVTQLTINLVSYDETTQNKINSYSQAVADTRIAEQRKSTADAQRQANDALAGSAASKDPAVITQNCLDLTERMVKEGKGMPAAWNCLNGPAQSVVNLR